MWQGIPASRSKRTTAITSSYGRIAFNACAVSAERSERFHLERVSISAESKPLGAQRWASSVSRMSRKNGSTSAMSTAPKIGISASRHHTDGRWSTPSASKRIALICGLSCIAACTYGRLTKQANRRPAARAKPRMRDVRVERRVRRHGDELVGPMAKMEACGELREAANDRTDPSLNHLVRALQPRWRAGDAERLCGLQVNYQLELGWLLHRNIGGLRALENLVNEAGCAAPMPRVGRKIGHQTAGSDKLAAAETGGHLGAKRQLDDADTMPKKHRVVHDDERAAFGARDRPVQFAFRRDVDTIEAQAKSLCAQRHRVKEESVGRVGAAHQRADSLELRHGRGQQLHLLGKNLRARRRSAGQVAAWPGQACNELRTHRVSGVDHDDGQTGSTLTRRADARRAEGKDQRHRERLEFGGEFALALRIQTRPADFDQEVLSFDPA